MAKMPAGFDEHYAHRGRYGDVIFARMKDGSRPCEQFFDRLSEKQQAKFLSQFIAITSDAGLRLPNRQQFKQVAGRLFEFKRNDLKMKIFTFREQNVWYLVHGLSGKKEDDLPKREVDNALALMEEARSVLGVGTK